MTPAGAGEWLGLQAALARLAAVATAESRAVVTHWSAALETEIRREASQPRTRIRPNRGAPEGPRLLTGSYVGSIHREVSSSWAETNGVVASNDIRSFPLELGSRNLFGRGIRMRPYPHFGPGLDRIEPGFLAAMAAVPGAAAQATRRFGAS